MIAELTLSVVTGILLKEATGYVFSEGRKFKKQVELAFDRGRLYYKDGSTILKPRCSKMVKQDFGWEMEYELPVGLTCDDIYNMTRILQGATRSEIELYPDSQSVNIHFHNHPIPHKIGFDPSVVNHLKKYPLSVGIGFGRKGFITHELSDGPAPHLLIGGLSGSGKSSTINFMITTMAMAYPPSHLIMTLIDTKMTELFKFKGLGHVRSCSLDVSEGQKAMSELLSEMIDRQEFMMNKGLTDIKVYNRLYPENPLPYHVVFIDEFGDFDGCDHFWNSTRDVGRKGRSLGFHLIMATQRPDAGTLPPNVKANLGAVVAHRAKTRSNSQILIDSDKAFKLPLVPGRAIYQYDDSREIQVPLVTSDDIYNHLGLVYNQRVEEDDTGQITKAIQGIIEIGESEERMMPNEKSRINQDLSATISDLEKLRSDIKSQLINCGKLLIRCKSRIEENHPDKVFWIREGKSLKEKYDSLKENLSKIDNQLSFLQNISS